MLLAASTTRIAVVIEIMRSIRWHNRTDPCAALNGTIGRLRMMMGRVL